MLCIKIEIKLIYLELFNAYLVWLGIYIKHG